MSSPTLLDQARSRFRQVVTDGEGDDPRRSLAGLVPWLWSD